MDQNNTTLSKQQLDDKISRELMAGMDGDLSNISQEAADVLASLDGALFQDDEGSVLTNIGKPKATAAMPPQERVQLLAESQELFPQQQIVVPDAITPEPLQETITEEDAEPYIPEDLFIDEEEAVFPMEEEPPQAQLEAYIPQPVQPIAEAAFFDDGEEEEVSQAQSFGSTLRSTAIAQRLFLGALALICIASFASLGIRFVKESRLLASKTMFGVSVEGTLLEGMTLDEARDTIEEITAQKDTAKQITLKAGEHTATTTLDVFSPQYDTQGACAQAWDIGRTGSRSQRLFDICSSRMVPQTVTIDCSFDEKAVQAYVSSLAQTVDRPVQDASLTFSPDEMRESDYPFVEVEEVQGQALDQDFAVQAIRDCAISGDTVVELALNYTDPKVCLADLKENVQPMRTFTTEYGRSYNRVFNIHRATDAINGTVLQPGDEFSFNRIVGNTSLAENGYMAAGVIIGGRSATDRGGGVCQAATTLYNVAVRCDMEITARGPHAIASTYVPRGQDATIAYGYYDMAFVNTSEYPVYIIGTYTDTSVTFTMYGRPLEDGVTIEMESELLGTRSPASAKVTEDPTKPVGYKETVVSALYGYDVRVYKVWFDADGNEIRRVVDHTDAYPTRRAEIIVGTKQPTPAPTPDGGAEGGTTDDGGADA